MELWIRSQDRNVLMPINSKLELLYDAPKHILIISANTILGAYKSRQRVLEVLDEIQIIVKWCQKNMKDVTIGDYNKLIGSFNDYVYEMPQE